MENSDTIREVLENAAEQISSGAMPAASFSESLYLIPTLRKDALSQNGSPIFNLASAVKNKTQDPELAAQANLAMFSVQVAQNNFGGSTVDEMCKQREGLSLEGRQQMEAVLGDVFPVDAAKIKALSAEEKSKAFSRCGGLWNSSVGNPEIEARASQSALALMEGMGNKNPDMLERWQWRLKDAAAKLDPAAVPPESASLCALKGISPTVVAQDEWDPKGYGKIAEKFNAGGFEHEEQLLRVMGEIPDLPEAVLKKSGGAINNLVGAIVARTKDPVLVAKAGLAGLASDVANGNHNGEQIYETYQRRGNLDINGREQMGRVLDCVFETDSQKLSALTEEQKVGHIRHMQGVLDHSHYEPELELRAKRSMGLTMLAQKTSDVAGAQQYLSEAANCISQLPKDHTLNMDMFLITDIEKMEKLSKEEQVFCNRCAHNVAGRYYVGLEPDGLAGRAALSYAVSTATLTPQAGGIIAEQLPLAYRWRGKVSASCEKDFQKFEQVVLPLGGRSTAYDSAGVQKALDGRYNVGWQLAERLEQCKMKSPEVARGMPQHGTSKVEGFCNISRGLPSMLLDGLKRLVKGPQLGMEPA